MTITAACINGYADLGDAWLRNQTARFRQMELLFGRHFRLDFNAVSPRAGRLARTARSVGISILREHVSNDAVRLVTIEAIEHCARLDALAVHAIAL